MRPRRTRTLTAGLVLSALLASACAGEGQADLREPVAGARTGGTITVGIGRPGSIDPGNAYEPNGQYVVRTMCDTMLQQDPLTGELVGGLAESWLVTDLGNKFTVRLRDDLTFSNGDKVTADDLLRGLSRIASQEYASGVQSLLALVDGYEEIAGEVETDDDDDLATLRGLRVIDSRSLEIRLRRAGTVDVRFPDFLRVLTHPATAPINSRVIRDDPDAMASAPVCVGPYELAEPWDGGDEIRLVRSASHRPVNGAYTSGGAGYADEVVFRIFEDDRARERAWARGDIDVVAVDAASRVGARGDRVSGPSGAVEFVGLPGGGGSPLNDPVVREAFSLALDRERLTRRVWGDGAIPATSFYPPTLGPEFHVADACSDTLPPRADVEAARALLRANAIDLRRLLPQGLPFFYNDEGRNGRLATEVAAQWGDAFGIDVLPEPLEWRPFVQQATGSDGFDGAFRESWSPPYQAPEQYINALFTASAVGNANWSRFSDPAFSLALDRHVRRNDDAEDIQVEYRRMETEFLCPLLPLIPVAFGMRTHLVRQSAIASANGQLLDAGTGWPLIRELYRVAD